jgi:hypothetical protein
MIAVGHVFEEGRIRGGVVVDLTDHRKKANASSKVDERLDERIERASTPRFSDDDLALRFTVRYADELRYTEHWHRWHRWKGAYWREDDTLAVPDLARDVLS